MRIPFRNTVNYFRDAIFRLVFQEAELEARREEERMQEYRRQIIEEERQRLLQEHATKLLGYLPKVGHVKFEL